MKPTVYIETTIPSYYCDHRPALAADIARTREWWDQERADYECFVSLVVLEEAVHLDILNARLHVGLPRLVTPQQLRRIEEYP